MNTINGKIIEIFQTQTGINQSGKQWAKGGIVIETIEQYPKKVAITLFNQRLDQIQTLIIGDSVSVEISPESREYNGRWYTDIMGLNVTKIAAEQPQATQVATGNDLPF